MTTEAIARGHSILAAMGGPYRKPIKTKPRREMLYDILSANRGKWYTLYELCELVGGSQTGTSAKLRDLRKPMYGAHPVESRKKPGTNKTFEYSLA